VFDIYISGLIYDGGARTENANTGKFPTCCCRQGLAIYIGKLKGTLARDFSPHQSNLCGLFVNKKIFGLDEIFKVSIFPVNFFNGTKKELSKNCSLISRSKLFLRTLSRSGYGKKWDYYLCQKQKFRRSHAPCLLSGQFF
jgi:hypothetical protein